MIIRKIKYKNGTGGLSIEIGKLGIFIGTSGFSIDFIGGFHYEYYAYLKQVNKALKKEFGDLQLVRGKGYYYFTGTVCQSWKQKELYGGWLLKDTKISEYVQEAQRRNKKS